MDQKKVIEGASGTSTPLSPGLSGIAHQELQWANAGEKLAVLNFSEKVIEEKERHLRECIANNYTRIKDVERELSGLQMQLKLSTGPKKSALMMIRKKIEVQNERVLTARDRQRAARKVFEAAEEALKTEEQVKERLCQELNLLVQQSAHAQLEKLEQLTARLERMNESVGYGADTEKQHEEELAKAAMESLRRVPSPQQAAPSAEASVETLPVGAPTAGESAAAAAGESHAASPSKQTISQPTSLTGDIASQRLETSPPPSRQSRQQAQPGQTTPRKPMLQSPRGSGGSPNVSPAHAAAARTRHVPLAAPARPTPSSVPANGPAASQPPAGSGFRGFDT
ncbi:g6569 [Coccomyxa elongata]